MNIAFIPVRGGSKSIPLKNIKLLNGKPLVYWTAYSAQNAKCIDKLVIATDSKEIKQTVLSFGFSKLEVYDRNPENAKDTSSTESVMIEYLNQSNLKDNDLFFLVQATSPLLKSEHIDGMYNSFSKSNADSMFTGVVEKQFKWIISNPLPAGEGAVVGESRTNAGEGTIQNLRPVNYDYRNRPRRQDFEGLIAETGACYINSVGNIKRDNCRLSGKVSFYELPAYTSYEIDEPDDWIIIEELMKRY